MAVPFFLKRFYYRNWFWFHSIRRWEYGIAKRFVRGAFLDAGCGNGALTAGFSRLVRETRAVDSSDEALRAAKEFNNPGGRVSYSRGDLRKLRFPSGRFDSVACISVLGQCGSRRDEVVRELLRVTRPGGVIVLSANSVFIDELAVVKKKNSDDLGFANFEVQRFYALKSKPLRAAYDFFLKYRDWRTLFSFVLHPLFWLDARFSGGVGQTELVVIKKPRKTKE